MKKEKMMAVLSFVAPDRIGTVMEVTAFLKDRGANVIASNGGRLDGYFSGDVLFEATPQELECIEQDYLPALFHANPALRHIRDEINTQRVRARGYKLDILTSDNEGLLFEVARCMTENHIDVVRYRCDRVTAPHSGTPLFRMEFRLASESPISPVAMEDLLNSVESPGWDVDVQPLDDHETDQMVAIRSPSFVPELTEVV